MLVDASVKALEDFNGQENDLIILNFQLKKRIFKIWPKLTKLEANWEKESILDLLTTSQKP